MRNRLMVTLAVALSLAHVAPMLAQRAGAESVAQKGPVLPAQLGGARLERTIDYGREHQRPELGHGYFYAIGGGGRLPASVYLYDLGRPVPAGADSPMAIEEFDQAYADIRAVAQKDGRYRELRPVGGPGACAYAGIRFRCITLSALDRTGQRVHTRMILTAIGGKFLKVRVDWPLGLADAEPRVERFLEAVADRFR